MDKVHTDICYSVTPDEKPSLLALSSPFGLVGGLGSIFSKDCRMPRSQRSLLGKNVLLVFRTNFWSRNGGVSFLGNFVSSFMVDMKNSVAAFVVGKRKLPRLALLAFPHDSKQLLMDPLRSSLWLQFKPYQIAAGAAYLASKFLNMDFASHHSVWKEFQTPPNVLRVKHSFMELRWEKQAFPRLYGPANSILTLIQ
ncbi:hypothetical protein MTR67_041082 [Solanum verrucosum]|uniref:Uncharacterized protein n=1 Tax=Solanum verrucosum TaxID=315347 RepID=A0AAF0UKD1_SOLVR|nr:hypothetical protein MTR67_041082 [Solanum verrucosum]